MRHANCAAGLALPFLQQPGVRTDFWPLLLLLCLVLPASQSCGQLAAAEPLWLTNAAQVLRFVPAQPVQTVPTRLRAVVTYADAPWDLWFLKDDTGGVALERTQSAPALEAGMLVEVVGQAKASSFAPVVREEQMRVLGRGPLPPATRTSAEDLGGGRQDCQWIELDAIIQSVTEEGSHLHFSSEWPARLHLFLPMAAPSALSRQFVDAKVRVRGVCGTRFNGFGQLIGYRLFVPSLDCIQVLQPAPADPFAGPAEPLTATLQYTNTSRFGHRFKVGGIVTAMASSREFFVQDQTGAAHVQSVDGTVALAPGDAVELVAFPEPLGVTPRLHEALVRKVGRGALPAPIDINPAKDLLEDWDARLVRVDADVVDRIDRPDRLDLLLRCGERLVEAKLLGGDNRHLLKAVRPGARIRLVSACTVELNSAQEAEDMNLTCSSAASVEVLRTAPWWTIGRLATLSAGIVVLFGFWGMDRLRREARLHRHYGQMFRNASDLFSTHDRGGNFLFLNAAWERVTGFPERELKTRAFATLLAPGQEEAWQRWWSTVQAGQPTQPAEWEVVSAAGGRLWLEMSGLLETRSHAQPVVECVSRDATARRRAEQFGAGQKRTLELLATGAPLPVLLTHLVRFVEEQSPGMMCSILLLDNDGVTLRQGVAPSLPEEYNRAIDGLVAAEGRGSCGTAVARRSGVTVTDVQTDPLWTDFRELAAQHGIRACWSAPIFSRDNSVLGTFAVYYRTPHEPSPAERELITAARSLASIAVERKLAEEALQRLSTLQQAILDSASVSIIATSIDGTILSFNRAAEAMLGYSAIDVIGQRNAVTLHDPAELSARAAALSLELGRPVAAGFEVFTARANAGLPEEHEWTFLRKDGTRLPVQLVVTAVRDGSGGLGGYLGVGMDLTRRKADEQARAELEEQLRQSQKMQAIGTLAGGIAHDFNNILTAILGYAEILRDDLGQQPDALEKLAEILKAGGRARDLVQQILAFSHRKESKRSLIHLETVVLEVLRLLRASLPATLQVRTMIRPSDFLVMADPTQVHQVLMNLCSNAAHAMRGRPGVLEVAMDLVAPDEALLRAHPQLSAGNYFCLTVADNGHGMDEATLQRIFEPFFTSKPAGEGTGLGLSVVHGIMRAHQGVVTASSTPGQGSEFRLYFPAVPPGSGEETEAPRELVRGRDQRLLIVDDEPANATLAGRNLQRLGYQTVTFTNPREALAWAREHPEEFDLLLTDLTMPGLTGTELIRQIRMLRPEVPVVLCSGYLDALEGRAADLAGEGEVLGKPFTLEELSRAVAEALAKA